MKKKEDEPRIDESLLTKEQYDELHRKRNYKPWIIFSATLFVLMAICVIVIVICRNA
jgi:hypothetical protein